MREAKELQQPPHARSGSPVAIIDHKVRTALNACLLQELRHRRKPGHLREEVPAKILPAKQQLEGILNVRLAELVLRLLYRQPFEERHVKYLQIAVVQVVQKPLCSYHGRVHLHGNNASRRHPK